MVWRSTCPLFLVGAMLVLSGCGPKHDVIVEPEPEPIVCTEPFEPRAAAYQVVGFYPAWKHDLLPPSEVRWDKLTRVVYAFALPRADGSLDVSDLTRVDELATAAHGQGVAVYLSVGGGAGSEDFPAMAADPVARTTFVRTVRDYLGTHCLDGVDIDWEHWTKDPQGRPLDAEVLGLVTLLRELRFELAPLGLKISLDLFASHWNGQHIEDRALALVDDAHVMAYDFSGPWSAPGPHASFEQAIGTGTGVSSTGLAYWTRYRAFSNGRFLLGVPFYGRDFDTDGGAGIAYRDIVARYPEAPNGDRVANIYYNGVQTIADKARYVVENGYAGVMIWELAQDTRDDATSLLHAIDRVVNPAGSASQGE